MAEEDKFADEMLTEEELDGVAGGSISEIWDDGEKLYERGLLSLDDEFNVTKIREKLHEMGYTGYKDVINFLEGNIYTDKSGNIITRNQFWENFDAENGTKKIERKGFENIFK